MKFITTRTHGVLDYIAGFLLLALPWIFGNGGTGPESLVPTFLGILTIAMALMTNYENSVLKIIPMQVHLSIDTASGLFLALSPWIFQFDGVAYLPHLIFGTAEIIIVLLSKSVRDEDGGTQHLI